MNEDESRTQQVIDRMNRWSHHRWVPPPNEPRRDPSLMPPRGEVGSLWRLPAPGWFIERPRQDPTLALSADDQHRQAELAPGTRLRLVEIDDLSGWRPDDLVTWVTYVDGWETRTYVVEDGAWAGRRIVFPDNPAGGRLPWASVLAHTALEPVDEDDPS